MIYALINTEPIKKFGNNIVDFILKNTNDNDYIMLCIDDNIYHECINGIDQKELETELAKIKFRFNYQSNDFIPIAIASFQVKLFSDLKSYNEDTIKSNALKELFCQIYNLDSNQMYYEESSYQERLWKHVQCIFKERYKRNLIYKNWSFKDKYTKNDYVGCPKSQLFFLNNNIQILFYSINKRLETQRKYSLNEIKYLFSSSRITAGIQLEFYRKFQEFTSDYNSYNLGKMQNLISLIIYVFSNNRDPNIFTKEYIDFYQQETEDNLDGDQLVLTLTHLPNNNYIVNIFANSEQIPLGLEEIEIYLSQMMEENYFLYFERKDYNWEYTNIYTKSSFAKDFVIITTEQYFFPNSSYKSSCGQNFVAYTYENTPDEIIKKLNTDILGKVYSSAYLLGGIKIGVKKYLQGCSPWINPELCKNPPDLTEPNFYTIEFKNTHTESILVCENKPDNQTYEILANTEIGWDLNTAYILRDTSSLNTVNGLLCSFSSEDRERIKEDKILSQIELFSEKSIMNHFMKMKYHEFDTESSIYKLIKRGKYGL